MDARRLRSQRRLHAAVLHLAATTPVTELTATAVAREAQVNRSTFYLHADDPAGLLRAALLGELDELRADLLTDRDRPTAAAVAEVTAGVLEHVRRHADLYRRGLADDAGPASLHGMLAEHFRESSRQLVEQGRLTLPLHARGVPAPVLGDAAVSFVALGTVGAIRAWLALPAPLEVETFTALHAALLPPWWVQG